MLLSGVRTECSDWRKVLRRSTPEPCLFVTSETNKLIKDTFGAPMLGTFDAAGHTNWGQSED